MAGRGVPGPRHAGTHRQWSGGAPHPPHLRLALLGQGKPEASPTATQQDQADPSLSLAPLPHVQAEGPVWGGRLHPGISPGHSRNPPASWTRPPPRASTARPWCPALQSRAGPVGKGREDSGQCLLLPPAWLAPAASPCQTGQDSVTRPAGWPLQRASAAHSPDFPGPLQRPLAWACSPALTPLSD